MSIKKVLLFVLILLSINCLSQTRRFTHLTSNDGISQSEVYSFLEDSRGFMWFGTVDGLNRYDGYNIEIFNTEKNDPHALSNNTVRSLAEDHMGRIWVGTDDGLNLFDPETELIFQIEVEAFKNKSLPVWSLLVDDGFLYLGTNNGLWRTNIQRKNLEEIGTGFTHIKNFRNEDKIIRSVIKCKNGGLWILAPGNISRIIFQQGSANPIVIEDVLFSDLTIAVSLTEDSLGNVWIAFTRDGILKYNPVTKELYHYNKYGTPYGPSSEKCSALTTDKDGNLWVGTLDKGLSFVKSDMLDKEKITFESVQKRPFFSCSLNSNLIYSLYVSKDNHLWVGTIGSGVNIFNPNQKKFTHYKFRDLTGELPNSNFVRAVYADNQNRIWTGTHSNGLFLLDRENEKFHKIGFETQSVFFITKYKENKNFICTSTGLYIVELANNKVNILSQSNEGGAVFNVVQSKQNIYWYASVNGLMRAKVINDKITIDKVYDVRTSPNISVNNCRVLFYNKSRNELLTGTEGGGLNCVSLDDEHYPRDIKYYKKTTDPGSISNNYIRSIIQDSNQTVWIGTYEGLNKMVYDSSGKVSFQSFKKNEGLPNNMIQLLVEDTSHRLWIGTNGGLSQFFPKENKFINYTFNDGLQSNEFSEHTVFRKPDGEIIVGGINGINAFYPEQIEISSQVPRTTITDFYLSNEKISPLEKIGKRIPLRKSVVLTDSVYLLPRQNSIGFDFSAMIYPYTEKIKYAYKLEGFDEEWNFTDVDNRNANYTNLRHGDYIFKVKSTNNDGIWESTPKEIFIHIKTPFIYTWYAYVIYVLFAVLLFIYFSRYTFIRYATKKKLLLEKEHNEKLHELDELRARFFINISHDLRTPLTLIRAPLESVLETKNLSRDIQDKLQLVRRNIKRLNYLVEQLLDVRKAESGKLSPKLRSEDIVAFTREEMAHFNYAVKNKGLTATLTSSMDILPACFDPTMISKVYFNIISNAIKFTDKGTITIHIKRVDKDELEILKNAEYKTFIQVEIKDTGKGITEEQKSQIFTRFYQDRKNTGNGYGIGLSHSKELIDAHEGYIEAESAENIGTTIRFYLPVMENVPEQELKKEGSPEDIYVDEEMSTSIDSPAEKESGKQSILVAEDNADMRNFLKTELSKEFHMIEASDGEEGLKKAESEVPDLILSDIMMPNMNGLDFCRKVKSNVKISHIPVILLTAKVDTQTKYDGIELGADDYIPKPFEMQYLILRIKNLLQTREQLRKKFQSVPELEPSAVTVTSVDEKFLSDLMKTLEDGIPDTDFSVNSLETEMGMSHANFYRKVKSLTGQSGQELLQTMRMKRARQLLMDKKGLRIAEIAYLVGFTDPKYFSKCFKEKFGVAPSELRK